MKCLTLFLLLVSSFSYSIEFLYPVAYINQNDKDKIYVIYQKSVTHVELWLWDPDTKVATKGLLSSYTPAGFKLLPHNIGFSFIDNGRVKIKRFNRRSPRSIDIYEPIYNISEIEWIDVDNFYVSAKKDGKFGIFHIDSHGIIKSILEEKHRDCMYPQKMKSDLFYIERIIKEGIYKRDFTSYKIIRTDYPDILDKKYFPDDLNAVENAEGYFKYLSNKEELHKKRPAIKKECLVDFRSCPIAFLKMVSEKEGFFLEHPTEADRQDKYLTFDYYHIKKVDAQWRCEEIFEFSVPAFLLLDARNDRLYESILPLLPRISENKIYFVDCSHNKDFRLDLFCYDMSTQQIQQKTVVDLGMFVFSPLFVKNRIYYGGIIGPEDGSAPVMWIHENGDVCIDLPCIK